MVRSFDATPVSEVWLDGLCADALWAPTAGNTAGVRMHTLGAELVGPYFAVATDETWRNTARRAEGLQRCGGIVLVTSSPSAYLARYAESDKSSDGVAVAHRRERLAGRPVGQFSQRDGDSGLGRNYRPTTFRDDSCRARRRPRRRVVLATTRRASSRRTSTPSGSLILLAHFRDRLQELNDRPSAKGRGTFRRVTA